VISTMASTFWIPCAVKTLSHCNSQSELAISESKERK